MGVKCLPGCGCGKHSHVPTTRHDKTCEECGEPFVAKRIDARFCSGTCNQRFYNREHRDRVRKHRREWQAANRERQKEYHREWHEEHAEEQRARKREKYREDRDNPALVTERRAKRRKYYDEHKEEIRANAKKRQEQDYKSKLRGLHRVDWDTMFEGFMSAQDGKCYLCGDPLDRETPKGIHLDHDHECCPLGRSCERCRRGLACKDCNRLIGIAREDAAKLRRIADNLERAKEQAKERIKLPRQPLQDWMYDFTCEVCGTPFRARKSNARFCSATCTSRAYRAAKAAS